MTLRHDLLYIVVDIETIPSPTVGEYFAGKEYNAPANYKDPVKIAEYVDAARKRDIETAGLHWWTGRICCIAAKNIEKGEFFSFCSENEDVVIMRFYSWLRAQRPANKEIPTLIGKSSATFDLPWLVGRSLANKIDIPFELRPPRYQDIDSLFGYGISSGQVTSLENYAYGLGIEGKLDGMSGADVAGLFAAGDYERIRKYCLHDVEITAEILERYLLLG